MLYGLKDRLRRARFAVQCGAVLRSPPLGLDASSNVALVSQIQHKDVLLYLLAAKSFARRIGVRAVHALDDGSLSSADRAVLQEHVPGVVMHRLEEFRSAACPSGGTWERLLAIAALVRDRYVVQLDSDTLTIGAIDEVRECVRRQVAFALGTWDRQKTEPMRERLETARKLSGRAAEHVQVVAEAHFDQLRDFESMRYVRGCSGFAGFAPGSFERRFVEDISVQMRAAIGAKWDEWGSEQVMSNIVIANVADAVVLPHPKYADCHKMRPGVTEFVHFIGSCRFDGGRYGRLGAQLIATL
ncbi:MAG TPA: hypothetical protein VF420_09745 [Casimicrobiaceae bacterium]